MKEDRELIAKYKLGLIGDFDESIERIKQIHEWDQKRIISLTNDLEKIQSEFHKSQQFSDMQNRLDEMEHNYYQGFPISDEENAAIKIWQEHHMRSMHKGEMNCDVAGGGWSIEFTPMTAGIVGSCFCNACRKKAQNLAFQSGKNWSELEEDYFKLCDAKFIFKDTRKR